MHETAALRFDPLQRRGCRIDGARAVARVPLGREGRMPRLFRRLAAPLHRPKRFVALDCRQVRRLGKIWKLTAQLSEPVGTNEPLRCCCACALGFEAVPTPHLTLAGDEALANGKGLVLVGLDNGDLLEPTHQFGWRADMIREAFRTGGQGRIARPGFASGPTPRAIAITDRGIGIFAEGRCERSLVTGLRREARDDRSAAMLKGGCKRAMFGFGSRERRSRRRELRLG